MLWRQAPVVPRVKRRAIACDLVSCCAQGSVRTTTSNSGNGAVSLVHLCGIGVCSGVGPGQPGAPPDPLLPCQHSIKHVSTHSTRARGLVSRLQDQAACTKPGTVQLRPLRTRHESERQGVGHLVAAWPSLHGRRTVAFRHSRRHRQHGLLLTRSHQSTAYSGRAHRLSIIGFRRKACKCSGQGSESRT